MQVPEHAAWQARGLQNISDTWWARGVIGLHLLQVPVLCLLQGKIICSLSIGLDFYLRFRCGSGDSMNGENVRKDLVLIAVSGLPVLSP